MLFVFLLFGCASNPMEHSIKTFNKNLEKKFSAYRYVKTEDVSSHTTYELQPAGSKQQTGAINSELLLSDTFKSIKQKCNFDKQDLVETRVVSHKYPWFYEVWIFKDVLAEREDKKTALSVRFLAYPDNGGTDIFILGKCHGEKRIVVFGK